MIGMHECLRCENFISGERSPYTWKYRAFPDGIPYERFSNINESNRDYCNNGIDFVSQKEKTASKMFTCLVIENEGDDLCGRSRTVYDPR